MCYYCGFYQDYRYLLPYQYSATPYSFPPYGFTYPSFPTPYPEVTAYVAPAPVVAVAPAPAPLPGYVVPYFPRGEHRVANCYCVCQ